jgi:metal-responsive CopG/Arc/MetJ family transcriptional regulator
MLNKVEKTPNIDNNETIAITLRLPKILIEEIDQLIIEKGFRNRQDAIREILREKLKEGGN